MNRQSQFLLWATVVLISVQTAPAADFSRDAAVVAPYIDAQTVAIVGVDVEKLDLAPVTEFVDGVIPGAGASLSKASRRITELCAAIRKAGFDRVAAVVSLAYLPDPPPIFVFPKSSTSDAAALEKALSAILVDSKPPLVFADHGDVVVAAAPNVLAKLNHLKPVERPELAVALAEAGDCVVAVAFAISDEHRRVISELMPVLPAEVGGEPSTAITRGVQWAAASIHAPPQPSLRIVIQSDDEASAASLLRVWKAGTWQISKSLKQGEAALFDAVSWLLTPKQEGDRLTIALEGTEQTAQIVSTFSPALRRMRESSLRRSSMNNLKMLMLALLNFENAHGQFPAIGTFDAAGRPMLSWRVHILPYLDDEQAVALYQQFKLDEPWDSPHNKALLSEMPEVFRCPASAHAASSGLATYREVVGEHTIWPGHQGITFKQIIDGSSNTICLVEVDDDHAAPWTKPEGLPFDPDGPPEGLGGQFSNGFNAAICDGSVHFIAADAAADLIVRLLTRDGKETIEWP